MPDTSTTPVDTCCDRHHYSCHLGEDGPPIYCCGACPARSKLNSRASIGPDSERIRESEQVIADALANRKWLDHVDEAEEIAARLRAAGLLPGPDDIVVSREALRTVLGEQQLHPYGDDADCPECAARAILRAALSQPHPAQEQQ